MGGALPFVKEVVLVDIPNPMPSLGKEQTEQTFLVLKEVITPEAGDKYIQTLIILMHENTIVQFTVLSCKHDTSSNIIGHVMSIIIPLWTHCFMILSLLAESHFPQSQHHCQGFAYTVPDVGY